MKEKVLIEACRRGRAICLASRRQQLAEDPSNDEVLSIFESVLKRTPWKPRRAARIQPRRRR